MTARSKKDSSELIVAAMPKAEKVQGLQASTLKLIPNASLLVIPWQLTASTQFNFQSST